MWYKYHVSAREDRTYDGIVFDSKAEMEYYREVVLPLAAAGEIVQYELQKSFVLQPGFRHDGKAVRAITYAACEKRGTSKRNESTRSNTAVDKE